VSDLAERVLPLIRTRADLWTWSASSAHGMRMHQAVAVLQAASEVEDPATVLTVTQKAIASAMSVIMRADDSGGVIGDACQDLLDLHPAGAARARPPAHKLVEWMIRFEFDNDCDYFHLDPVAYAPALGKAGIAAYRARLAEIEASLGPRPSEARRWTSPQSRQWFSLELNAQRLAVYDRDVDAVIRTHARDRWVPAWLHDTARALEEIGETTLAIEWARQATDHSGAAHQAMQAGDYWCSLLAEHQPADLLDARLVVFRRWPSMTTATRLFRDAGSDWPQHRDEVMQTLADRPRDAVLFAMHTLDDLPLAWELAHSLALDDDGTWKDLAEEYEPFDRLAVLPVYARLVDSDLVTADAKNYRAAARRLARMRKLAYGSEHAREVDTLISELRVTHRHRPRLQTEFTRAGLP